MAEGTDNVITKLHKEVLYPTVRVRTEKAGGNGTVLFSEKNVKGKVETYVVTNHHVVEDAIEVKNNLDNAIYQAEKMKSDNKDKISEEDKKTIEDAIEDAKKIASKEDASKEELEDAAKSLNDKIMPIGAKMYEQSNDDSNDKDEKDTVEGEVVDEDQQKDEKEDKKSKK
jgi:hypothetical protein